MRAPRKRGAFSFARNRWKHPCKATDEDRRSRPTGRAAVLKSELDANHGSIAGSARYHGLVGVKIDGHAVIYPHLCLRRHFRINGIKWCEPVSAGIGGTDDDIPCCRRGTVAAGDRDGGVGGGLGTSFEFGCHMGQFYGWRSLGQRHELSCHYHTQGHLDGRLWRQWGANRDRKRANFTYVAGCSTRSPTNISHVEAPPVPKGGSVR